MVKVMFLCIGNSCRSQIAEGCTLKLGKGIFEPFSAGLSPSGVVHPKAVAVMKEIGMDISRQRSKGIDKDLLEQMEIVITLCGNAEASCPMTPPKIEHLNWAIDDPVVAKGTEEEILAEFRKARDEIKIRIEELIPS